MNIYRNKRFSTPLMTLLAIAILSILMAFTIQILCEAYQFVGTMLESASGQTGKFITVISAHR